VRVCSCELEHLVIFGVTRQISRSAQILKSQPAPRFTVENHCKTTFEKLYFADRHLVFDEADQLLGTNSQKSARS